MTARTDGSLPPSVPELPPGVPEIPVVQLVAATEYYRDRMGFTVDWVAEEIDLAGISRDACRLFVSGPSFRATRGNAAPVVTWLNLESRAAVDALYAAWRAGGVRLMSAPESKAWGLHEFMAADADGNQFRIFHDFATVERERVGPAVVDRCADGAIGVPPSHVSTSNRAP